MNTPPAPAADWAASGERSNLLALKVMAWIALRLGRRVARWCLHPITAYFVLFAPTARRHGTRFLQRALGRAPTWRDHYRRIHAFASTVLDRIYFVRGQLPLFDIQLVDVHLVDECIAQGRGAFLLGAHIGSFEGLHAIGANRPGMRVAMAMFPDNARMVHRVLQSIAPDFEMGIIAVGRPGSTLAIRDWLDGNGLVGLLGDRHVPGEGPRSASVRLPFLGADAPFNEGPLRLAQLLQRRVIFMVALYRGGRRYEMRFLELADFRQPVPPAEREGQLRAALQRYVQQLESLVREAPDNWFNFHDYWQEETPAPSHAGGPSSGATSGSSGGPSSGPSGGPIHKPHA